VREGDLFVHDWRNALENGVQKIFKMGEFHKDYEQAEYSSVSLYLRLDNVAVEHVVKKH
jgi:hypothetical protein